MSALVSGSTHIDPSQIRPVVWGNGVGAVLFGGSGFLSITDPLDARRLAVALSELANQMEAAQRQKEAV
jgi:hypothetical protein